MRRLLCALLLALAGLAGAQAASDSPGWNELSAGQRTALAPLKSHWQNMNDDQRQKWLELAARFPTLSPAERERLQQRMVEWSRLSPAERGQARLQFQEAQRWSPQERQDRWEAYQSLDPQARQVLAERWKLEAAAQAKARAVPPPPDKRNLLEPGAPAVAPRQAATATSVRAGAGATTQPISSARPAPPHHQTGVPKIAATPTFVDPATLLPKRGPQGAAVAARAASAAKD